MEVVAEFAQELGKTSDGLGKKTRECDALTVNAGKLEKGLRRLLNPPKVNEEKIQGLESQVSSDAMAIAQLATLVRDHRSNCLRVTAENGDLWRRGNNLEEETCEAVLPAEQLRANVSFLTGERDA